VVRPHAPPNACHRNVPSLHRWGFCGCRTSRPVGRDRLSAPSRWPKPALCLMHGGRIHRGRIPYGQRQASWVDHCRSRILLALYCTSVDHPEYELRRYNLGPHRWRHHRVPVRRGIGCSLTPFHDPAIRQKMAPLIPQPLRCDTLSTWHHDILNPSKH